MQKNRIPSILCTLVLAIALLNIQYIGYSLDTSKYIAIDEVQTDMEAYCLTVFSGTEVERFGLEVLSVVRNQRPGQNMILVKGTDQRFLNNSAVHGCSGSPVYIDGRMAGALAAGWDGSLEPLYLVRPIEDMLEVGTAGTASETANAVSMAHNDAQVLDLKASYEHYLDSLKGGYPDSRMSLSLSSSLPASVIEPFSGTFKEMGLDTVAAGALLPSSSFAETGSIKVGGVLALILCGGDISLAATGTVTEVIGDQFYGFGHQFNGTGSVNFPVAAGIVHTVVGSRDSSFKFSSPGPVLGTLEYDQTSAVRGTIGQMPQTIDLNIGIDRYNDPQHRDYDCYLAVDPRLSPLITQIALNGAAQVQGALPPEHTVNYSGRVVVDENDIIAFDNISSQRSLMEASTEVASVVSMLLNNEFEKVRINSIDVNLAIEPKNILASIWAVRVNQTTVRPGQTVTATVVLKTYRSQEEIVSIDLKVPDTLAPGKYTIQIIGSGRYRSFASGLAPHKFRAIDLPSLKTGLNRVLQYRRDKLYAVMETPASGLIIREHEMGQLPPTKMLLMQDSKRLIPLEPYKAWTENSITLDRIVQGGAEIQIEVKK